ncbi:Os03g0770300 [Oryza sativa Japonica Group]|jgi:hypothetical protein|uniref:Uncharacterized protein n=2 Tax=Oryza sativa subsp. japonica TaxID=39947 RepID=A3AN32_ORYSJ|nr:hypothetical protein [Oryza sativa Japonica Group]EAZ28721.1 hypothetical protein OsJ_12741 [Oryza sativa Japonica Group]BAS86587.1 Os03g0770300 [Oryza sativa Japonica Group]
MASQSRLTISGAHAFFPYLSFPEYSLIHRNLPAVSSPLPPVDGEASRPPGHRLHCLRPRPLPSRIVPTEAMEGRSKRRHRLGKPPPDLQAGAVGGCADGRGNKGPAPPTSTSRGRATSHSSAPPRSCWTLTASHPPPRSAAGFALTTPFRVGVGTNRTVFSEHHPHKALPITSAPSRTDAAASMDAPVGEN